MRQGRTAVEAALYLATMAAISLAGSTSDAYEVRETLLGSPVRWNVPEVEVVLDESLAAIGDFDEVETIVVAAFDEWVVEADLPFDFHLRRGTCGEPGYRADGPNESCVSASEHSGGGDDAGATAFVSYAEGSGEILDADIVISLDEGPWSLDGGMDGDLDLRRVLLHEVGHFIGLAHSEVDDAAMHPVLTTDDAADDAALHQDDIAGAAALYSGLSFDSGCSSCDGCCAASGTPSGSLVFGAALSLLWLYRRRRISA